MTTSTLIRRILVGSAALVLGTAGLAFANGGVPLLSDQADEEAVLATTSDPAAAHAGGTAGGPPDEVPPAIAEENQEAAQAKHRAATGFAEQIRAWTRYIQANAQPDSEEEAAARDDTFDPKDGCQAPTTTPGGEDFDPNAPDGDEAEGEGGPPDGVGGPPEGAGPPEGVGGPPEGAGPPDGVGGGPPEGAGPPGN